MLKSPQDNKLREAKLFFIEADFVEAGFLISNF